MVHFNDSDNEGQPPCKLVKVSEATETFLKGLCTTHLPNSGRLQIRDAYSFPQVPATRTPQLDSYLKPKISLQGKAADKELAKVQTFVLDSLAPLSHLMELDAQAYKISHNEALSAARAAIELIGNANAKISHLRRTKVISQLNKSLLPLVEEDSYFEEVAPSLFGPEFAHRSKEHKEQVKAMRSAGTTGNSKQQFFRSGPPIAGGILPKARERRLPELPERNPPATAEVPVDQVNNVQTCIYNHLIINFKRTFVLHFRGLGLTPIQMTDLPLAGRLVHFFQNWSVITQDRWVLNTVQGYLIDFVSEPHQQFLPTPHITPQLRVS